MPRPLIAVAVGALRDQHGQVLVSQRRADVHLANFWELPGGKLEEGETPEQGLRRELQEEIGVDIRRLRPLRTLRQDYDGHSIQLHGYEILEFDGEPRSMEGQPLRWVSVDTLIRLPLPPGTIPLVASLLLPSQMAFTSAEPYDDLAHFQQRLHRFLRPAQARCLVVRLPGWSAEQVVAALRYAIPLLQQQQEIKLILHSRHLQDLIDFGEGWHLPEPLERIGLHFPASATSFPSAEVLQKLKLPSNPFPLGMSCHSLAEVIVAEALGADYVTLSPIQPTSSHPERNELGWEVLKETVQKSRLPIYALGGVSPADLPQALACGAQGVAGISAWW